MADDRSVAEDEELIARLRADLGCRTPSETGAHSLADAADIEDDAMVGGIPPGPTVSVSESALEIADRILAAASASRPR